MDTFTYPMLRSEIMDEIYSGAMTRAHKFGDRFENVLAAIYDGFMYRGGDFSKQVISGMGAFDTLHEYLFLEAIFATISEYSVDMDLKFKHLGKIDQIIEVRNLESLVADMDELDKKNLLNNMRLIGALQQ